MLTLFLGITGYMSKMEIFGKLIPTRDNSLDSLALNSGFVCSLLSDRFLQYLMKARQRKSSSKDNVQMALLILSFNNNIVYSPLCRPIFRLGRGENFVFGNFSLNKPLGRFRLYVAMAVCCMLCPPGDHTLEWTSDFWSKSV